MDIQFTAFLDPKKELGQIAKSKVKDFLKTREEYLAFEQIFVDIGKALYGAGKTGSESEQQLCVALCKEHMEQLAYLVHETDALQWQKIVESRLHMYCQQALISERDAKSVIARAVEMLKHRLAKQCPQFLVLMQLEELLHEIQVSGKRGEEHFRAMEQRTDVLLSNAEDILAQLEAIGSRILIEEKEPEQGDTDFDDVIRRIPVAEEEEWVLESRDTYGFFMDAKKRPQQRRELTNIWAKERDAYPGYYILPYAKAKELCRKTNGYGMFCSEDEMDADGMLDFSFEYCWRWKRAMFIISAYDCKQLRRFFEEYEEHLSQEGEASQDKLFRWFYIGLCLLSDAREEFDRSKWESVFAVLEKHLAQTGVHQEELGELLWMEQVKMKFARMQLTEVMQEIRLQMSGLKSYPVRLQLAGLLAECGDAIAAAEALEMLECEIIREVDDRVQAESRQRFLLSLLSAAYQLHKSLAYSIQCFGEEGMVCPTLPDETKRLDDYYSWDRTLESVQSDMLGWLYDTEKRKSTTFDVGRETVTIFGSGAPTCDGAYYLYRVMESAALPAEVWNTRYISKESLYYMQSAIFQMCPMLGYQLLLRGDNKEYIKRNFNHYFMVQRPVKEMRAMLAHLMKAFRLNMYEFKKHTGVLRQNQFAYLLENGVELLCRLSAISAPHQHGELLEIVAELMNENCITEFGGMDRLISYVFQYVPESKKADSMNLFLETVILQRTPIGRKSQMDVFEMLNRNESTSHYFEEAYVDEGCIEELLERRIKSPAEDRIRLERLIELYRFRKLSKEQSRRFATLLWQHRSEKSGLPDIPDRYMFSFLELPAPEGINVLVLIKEALRNWQWKEQLDGDGHSITMGNIRYFDEIKGLCDYFIRKEQIGFSGEEALAIFKDFEAYWQENKARVGKTGLEREELEREFVRRFEKMQAVIASLLKCCDETKSDEIRECVTCLYADMHASGVTAVNVKLLVGNAQEQAECVEEILDVLYGGEKTAAALGGAYDILTSHLLPPEAEEDFLMQILRIARTGKEKGLASLLAMIHNLFYSQKISFSEKVMKEVGKVLETIHCRFRYEQCDDEKQTKNTVLIRHFAALLASRVRCYCKVKIIAEPASVGEWHRICRGDEFMDVKNAWME